MKLTKSKLKQLIKEELAKIIDESNETPREKELGDRAYADGKADFADEKKGLVSTRHDKWNTIENGKYVDRYNDGYAEADPRWIKHAQAPGRYEGG